MRTFFFIFLVGSAWFNTAISTGFDDWLIEDYSLFPSLPIAAPWSENGQCREDSRKLIENLKAKTFWAMKMWDASAKTEFGMLYGNIYQGGNYDECLTVAHPITAKYCGVSVRAHVNASHGGDNPFEPEPGPEEIVWKMLVDSRRDRSKLPRDTAYWGLCVPASCTSQDILNSISRRLEQVNAEKNGTVHYVADIDDKYCQPSQQTRDYISMEIGFWAVTFTLVLIIIIATVLDLTQISFKLRQRESLSRRLLLCFSFLRSIRTFKTNPTDKISVSLRTLHTAKNVMIILVVLGHRFGLFFASGVLNYQDLENYLRTVKSSMFPQGDIIVDVFFFISGFLGSFFLLELLKKHHINPIWIIIRRYFRYFPIYAFILWFNASAFYRFGSGPLWPSLKSEEEYCQRNWWTNLLFINNYVNTESICLPHTWYLACDFHFFIIGTIIVTVISKHEKLGLSLLAVLMVLSALIPAYITYANQLDPLLFIYHKNLGSSIRNGKMFQLSYLPSHTKATVNFFGVLMGYMYSRFPKYRRKIPMKWSLVFFFLSLFLYISPMVYGSLFYQPGRPYSAIESALFVSVRKVSFGLGVCLYLTARLFGNLKFLNYIDFPQLMVPMSKLTFAVYLLHFNVIEASVAKSRMPGLFDEFDAFVRGCGDIFICFVAAGLLHLGIEVPFKKVFDELLLRKRISQKSETTQIRINEV